jgi:hypothetical protein
VEEAPSPAQSIEPEAPEEPTEKSIGLGTLAEEPAAPEEPTEPVEAPLFSTTDLAIIVAAAGAAVIGVAAYWALRKRK